jgi:hypothetical protein
MDVFTQLRKEIADCFGKSQAECAGALWEAEQALEAAGQTEVAQKIRLLKEGFQAGVEVAVEAAADEPANASPMAKEATRVRDVPLARLVLDILYAGQELQDLLDEAERNGWGKDDLDEDWPEDQPMRAIVGWSRARNAVHKSLEEGDYWTTDDNGDEELRSE